ncbi:hypothetical protein C7212DRAFT_358867 [Tuber magnatum]|uniref:CSN8/PSMD8/EIF3K domain-containing protein n=1 Tax=Tuber magnatum TaxID=42249 RepID=A0A317SK63_9PEZI|nr:hypothetical protein C7212DRAFT_358867 [Tuber magnatum]
MSTGEKYSVRGGRRGRGGGGGGGGRSSGSGSGGGNGNGGSSSGGTYGDTEGSNTQTASWRASRLKPAVDEYGFVSKGLLLDKKNQEKYYTEIAEKYVKFCGSSNSSTDLDAKLAAAIPSTSAIAAQGKNARYADSHNAELASIILSMRKLREGIVGSSRVDSFSSKAYMFMIRISILMKHSDSYHPAIQHLLYDIHPRVPLSASEKQEFAGYLVLHLASKMEAYSEAFMIKREFQVTDYRILQALDAMIQGNYWSFRATRRKVDLYKARLLEDADQRMRDHTLKCLAKSYFTVDVNYLESVTGTKWDGLKKEFGVGWDMNNSGIITIRKRKRPEQKAAPPTPRVTLDADFKAWE